MRWKSSDRLPQLAEIYDELPRIECRDLCTTSCAHATAQDVEREVLVGVVGRAPEPDREIRPLLEEGRCSVDSAAARRRQTASRPT